MSGAAGGGSAGGRAALSPCPELERSLSLLEPGGGRAEEQQRAGAEPMPMVFMCAGCRRPVGDTSSWVLNDEEGGCILLRSAAASVAVEPERKVSEIPGECGWDGERYFQAAVFLKQLHPRPCRSQPPVSPRNTSTSRTGLRAIHRRRL